DVLGNTKALEALRDGGFTLDEAHRLAYDDVERFKGSLIRAKEELQKAKGLALSYPGDPETLDVVERIFELATALREELTRRSNKTFCPCVGSGRTTYLTCSACSFPN